MTLRVELDVTGTLDDLPDGTQRVALTPEQQAQLVALWDEHLLPPPPPPVINLDDTVDGNLRVAMTPEQQSQLAVLWTDAALPPEPISLENTVDSYTANRLAMTPAERNKLFSIEEGAQVNPANLDGVPDGVSHLSMTPAERMKLASVAANAGPAPANLDAVPDSATRVAFTPTERSKLAGLTNAPASLDGLPDGITRVAFTPGERTALATLVSSGGGSGVPIEERDRAAFAYFGGQPPAVYMRYRNVYRLDKHFGVNNLVFDSSPTGGGTDERTKWIAIRQFLKTQHGTGTVELTGPSDALSRLGQNIWWDKDNTIFAGDWGMVNDFPDGNQKVSATLLTLNSVASANYIGALAGERLFCATDLYEGQQVVTLSAADYAAIPAAGARILIMNAYCGYDAPNGLVHPGKMWFTDVVKIGNNTIQFSEPLPFEITTETNPAAFGGAFPWKRADGSTINGSAFRICGLDGGVPGWMEGWVPGNKEFCVKGLEFHGVRLIAANGFMFLGMGQQSVFSRARLWARRGIWYFNTALGCRFEHNTCEFGSHTAEASMSSALNTWVGNRYSHHGQPGVVPNWMCALKEYSHRNRMEDETVWAPNYTPDTSVTFRVFLFDGSDNVVNGCNALIGYNGNGLRMIENDIAWGDPKYSGSRNKFEGVRVGTKAVRTAGGASIITEGNGNVLNSISCLYGAGSSSPSNLTVAGSNNVFAHVEDVGMATMRTLAFQAASANNTAQQCSLNVTNAGTGNVLTGNGANAAIPFGLQRPFWA